MPTSDKQSPWGAARVRKPDAPSDQPSRSNRDESRLYGVNACLAAFAKRPQDLRKVYLTESRIPNMQQVLAWCVKHKLGYRVVETGDLDRLTASRHHEGVCFDVSRRDLTALLDFLASRADRDVPSLLIWFDGIGNPHNFGAVLRSAAHFGADAVLIAVDSSLDASGAAARVAEGGAEALTIVRAERIDTTIEKLRCAGYAVAATVPRAGSDLYSTPLPARLVLVLGAESSGMQSALLDRADLRLTIPGSGAVESLNVAASAALLLGEYWRQRHPLR